jgi:hypothetical protein
VLVALSLGKVGAGAGAGRCVPSVVLAHDIPLAIINSLSPLLVFFGMTTYQLTRNCPQVSSGKQWILLAGVLLCVAQCLDTC